MLDAVTERAVPTESAGGQVWEALRLGHHYIGTDNAEEWMLAQIAEIMTQRQAEQRR